MKRRTILRQRLRDDRPLWQRWAAIVVGLLLLLLAPLLAHAQGGGPDTLQLVWTAPGDDADVGTAAGYELRVSTAPISLGTWGAANVIGPSQSPSPSGTREGFTVRGLSSDSTYYFAIRSVDEAGNWSPISNVLRWDWIADTTPPSAPLGVAGSKFDADARIIWSDNPEPDINGYSVYRATSATGPFAKLNATLVRGTEYLDAAVPTGVPTAWYRVSASDLSGNESAQSSATQIRLTGPRGAWRLPPVYPNPSMSAEPVCIPIDAPETGTEGATVDIVNSGGYRVRHIPLASSVSCNGTGVVWDGRNDAGRLVAPGVYRAWLIAGSSRVSVKLVRVP